MFDTAKNYKVQTSDSKLFKYLIKKYKANKLTFQKRSSMHKTVDHMAFITVTLSREYGGARAINCP